MNKKFTGITGLVVALISSIIYFSDRFREIFVRDIVGPVVADAKNVSSLEFMGYTVQPGYNIANEIFFGAIILFLLYVVYRTVDKHRIDDKIFLALTTILISGGFLRALGDTGMLEYPLNILLISPMTYISLTILGLVIYKAGFYFEDKKGFEAYRFIQYSGGAFLLFLAALIMRFAYMEGLSSEGLMVLPIALIVLLIIIGLQHALSIFRPGYILERSIGYVVSLGHALDGISSAYGVSNLGYVEKKPVSGWFMNAIGTPYGFLFLKVGLVFLFLSFIEKDNLDKFTYLVLFAIAAAGLGPGIRNVLRIILGI